MENQRSKRCRQPDRKDTLKARLCASCGAPLPRVRGVGRIPGESEAACCSRCGTRSQRVNVLPLAVLGSPSRLQSIREGELRLVTVVFCDVVGSTELAHALDPETLSRLIIAYHEIVSSEIEKHGGFVAQHLGDGILAYFGYPVAHEDDPRRAVQAGLSLFPAVASLNAELEADALPGLDTRVAVHTGHAFITRVGTADRYETLAIGEPINVAARLEAEVAGGTLVASRETLELAPGRFVYEPLGSFIPKGSARSIELNRVIGEVDVRDAGRLAAGKWSRGTPARHAGYTASRAEALATLVDLYRGAERGHGAVVLIEGEAGIGKSHLLNALHLRVERLPLSWFATSCSDELRGSALQPLIDLLRNALEFHSDDTPEEKLAKLYDALAETNDSPAEALPLFTSLLGLPPPPDDSTDHLSPARRRLKTFGAVRSWLARLCESRPVVVCVEDVDFADPSLLELIDLLAADARKSRLLLLMTCRTRPPSWRSRTDFVSCCLRPLRPEELGDLLADACPGYSLCHDVLRQLADRSAGVPLFAVELARSWIDNGCIRERGGFYEFSPKQRQLEIPSSLEGLLMARLDRLGPGKRFAQLCATLGSRFSYSLVRQVAELPGPDCEAEIQRLIEAEILVRSDNASETVYHFRHPMIREAARRSLGRDQARPIHSRAARAIDEHFLDVRHTNPEILADHYAAAGQPLEAVELYSCAARLQIERSAPAEAIVHLGRALDLIGSLDETSELLRTRIELLIETGVARQALCGYADQEAEDAFAKAHELCERGMDQDHLIPAISGLAAANLLAGRLQVARNLALRIHKKARNANDAAYLAWARYSLGLADLYLGDFAAAASELQAGIALSDSLAARGMRRYYSGDPAVDCRTQGAMALWFMGRTQDALALSDEAIRRAGDAEDTASLVSAEALRAILHQLCHDRFEAERHAARAIEISASRGFALWRGLAELTLAWCAARQGKLTSAMAGMRSAAATIVSTGTRLGTTYRIALEAEVRIAMGDLETARALLQEAEHTAAETSERYLSAELLRLRAECQLRCEASQREDALETLRASLDLARRQRAVGLERRVLASFAAHQAPPPDRPSPAGS